MLSIGLSTQWVGGRLPAATVAEGGLILCSAVRDKEIVNATGRA